MYISDKKWIGVWFVILLLPFTSRADCLQLGHVNHEGDNCLSFHLSWDNSWRNAYNHDAVYLFCKYRDASSGWQALRWSSDAGQHILSAGYELKVINGGSGVLIYKNGTDQGTSEVDVKLALAGLSGEEIKRAEFSVHGLEMVYVPTAPFYTSDSVLHSGYDASFQVYPSDGVCHFYAMKYELSQEQYVVFLNQLNRSAQYPRTIGGLLDGLREGDYVFGDLRTSPDHRNGIILHRRPSGSGEPYVFACNLDPGDVPGRLGDGQGVACNYLTPSDLLAYADWSGLRPLSEGEYEKMCRGNAFVLPSSGEYAWGKESAVCALSLSDESMETERAGNTDANVNAGGHLSGPSRVGMFVRPGSRPATGNSFWGISDLSGNVSELYYSRESSDFDGRVNGNGNLYNNGNCSVSSSLWPAVVSSFRLRGGSFLSDEAGLLLSSFREAADVPGGMDSRHAEVGFRLGISREVTEGVELKCKDYPDKGYRKRVYEWDRQYVYTGNYQTLHLLPGEYTMECWGASGGGSTNQNAGSHGGLGGYAAGTLKLDQLQDLYFYVGSTTSGTGGGWNGGGNGYSSGYGGGGASDIRLEPGVWNDRTSLISRIIVAGGGGGPDNPGGTLRGNDDGSGGAGGGLQGGAARIDGAIVKRSYYNASACSGCGCGMGGTQDKGYGLGRGENVNYGTDTGGAGGGFRGGYVSNHYNGGGGGGSGFVSGMPGCKAVDESGNFVDTPDHYSGFIFKNPEMNADVNPGNGKIKITLKH